ncbi:MAG: hypothetical protein ABI877_23700, partial [Gemmatimonadaceae bacterium]
MEILVKVNVTTIAGRVQMLNMQAPDEATAQRVMALIEEAIRTATIGLGMPGRVVVIRQLDVGTILQAASPASIALAVEAAIQRVASSAVSGDDPSAATAPMIYFTDDATVVLSLSQRVANGQPTTEWFWPSVVKGWTPNAPTDRAIALLIERAMATSAGMVTVAQVVEMLASTGVLDTLLARLSGSDGRALLKAIGWNEAMVHVRSPDAGPLPPQMPAHSQALVQRWVERWGGDVRDPRALWLGAMLLVADLPARSTNAQLPEVVRVWLASVVGQSLADADVDARTSAATLATRRDDLIADTRAWSQLHQRSPGDSLFGWGPRVAFGPRGPAFGTNVVVRRPHDEEPHGGEHTPGEPPTWKTPRPTNHAGILFLVPLLTHIGITRIVADNPGLIEGDWAAALLLRFARRLGVPRGDPAVAWITAHPVVISHADRSLTADVMRAARIHLRTEAGLTMRQLVYRSGAVVATQSAVDVLLHHADVDAAVRRAGLDG